MKSGQTLGYAALQRARITGELPDYDCRGRRAPSAHARMPSAVKSGLSAATKWPDLEGTGCFFLKVPSRPEQKALISYLKEHAGQPSAEYIDTRGLGRDALQWKLSTYEYRAVYRAAGKDVR